MDHWTYYYYYVIIQIQLRELLCVYATSTSQQLASQLVVEANSRLNSISNHSITASALPLIRLCYLQRCGCCCCCCTDASAQCCILLVHALAAGHSVSTYGVRLMLEYLAISFRSNCIGIELFTVSGHVLLYLVRMNMKRLSVVLIVFFFKKKAVFSLLAGLWKPIFSVDMYRRSRNTYTLDDLNKCWFTAANILTTYSLRRMADRSTIHSLLYVDVRTHSPSLITGPCAVRASVFGSPGMPCNSPSYKARFRPGRTRRPKQRLQLKNMHGPARPAATAAKKI